MKNFLISLLAGLTLTLSAQAATPRSIEMRVNGLVCAFCAQGIEKKLRKLDATADVLVSLEGKLVAVALKDGTDIPDETLRSLLTEAGYTLVEVRRVDEGLDAVRARLPQP